MMERILWISLFLVFVHWLIPGIMTLIFGFGVFKKTRTRREVSFTFDDGPDSNYTPRLLDLLREYKVKATFFVLGSKAEKCSELILRMHQEGHLIGIHNYQHQANWLMAPWKVKSQLNRSVDIIERITGVRPIYYRPPWGLLSLFDLYIQKNYRVVLWSLMVGDWWSIGGSKKIKNRLLKRVRGGAVILLHDSGTTWGANLNAPLHTIEALEDVFTEIRLQGYQCVRVDEMIRLHERMIHTQVSWRKRLLISLWMKWEKIFHMVSGMKPIDVNNQFLHVRVRIYRGKTIRLADGEEIRKGDRIAELHFDNELLFTMTTSSRSSIQLAIQMIRATEQLLPKILRLLRSHPTYQNVKGIYGVSLVHRGAKQLGFSVIDLQKGPLSLFIKAYLRILLIVVHPQGKQRLQSKKDLLIPKIIAMSTKELVRKYEIKNFAKI
ncbi:polysaccharide deacetylase family protein [Brevibacillus sp. NRS-1366]|uniref:polysaccharide deacetylase family protein n=1 Tax=Brevibacillus sp. NRS-1366 TaxID=3233899 RepID=UPI003D1FCE39